MKFTPVLGVWVSVRARVRVLMFKLDRITTADHWLIIINR